MDESLYGVYSRTKKLIETAEARGYEAHENIINLLSAWRETCETFEAAYPELLDLYESRNGIISSFTPEQIDHICYQIGDWYLQWKDKMWVDGKPNQHWLGNAKEQLKTMICGE